MQGIHQGSQLGKTARHSAIYAFGTMLSRLTALVMLPIYTRYLTPADYGVLELLQMALEISGVLIGMRISQAMFRFYILDDHAESRKTTVSTVLATLLATSSCGALLLYAAAQPLSVLLFGNADYTYEFRLFAFTLITNSVIAVGQAYLRARQMPVLFVTIGALTLALQVALNVIFVIMMDLHVTGVVYSALGSGIIVATGYMLYILGHTGFHYSLAVARRLVAFAAPLVLSSLAMFYVAYADKYFLRLFNSLVEVGLYALAARISSILETLFMAFNMSWSADRFEIVKRDNAAAVYAQVFRFLVALLVLGGTGLALFAGDFFRIMTAPEFYAASSIVPLLVAAAIFRIFTIFCNFGIMLNERTRHIAEASWLKAIIATAGYLLLIPYLGVYGAAGTLLAANIVEFLWVNRHATRAYDMQLGWRPAAMMLVAGTLCVVAGSLLPGGETDAFLARIGLYLALVAALLFMPLWSGDDRRLMKAALETSVRFVLRRKTA